MTKEDALREVETAIKAREFYEEAAKYEGLSVAEREFLQAAIAGQDQRIMAVKQWL